MALGPTVKQLRELLGLTQEELADRIGVERSYIGHIESGRTKIPGPDVLISLAHALRVEPQELVDAAVNLPRTRPVKEPSSDELMRAAQAAARREREEMEARIRELEAGRRIVRVPLVRQRASMGPGNAVDVETVPYVAQPGDSAESLMAVEVTGDCMEPHIHAGAIAIVDQSKTVDLHDGELVMVSHEGEALVKWYRVRPDGNWLESARRDRIKPNGETWVVGKVVAFQNPLPKPGE